MQIAPQCGAGAEVTGVDLNTLTDDQFSAIRQAYAQYGLLFFRDQDLSEEGHIAFAKRFAPININRFFAAHPRYPEIAMVTKEPDQTANIGGSWHTDHTYDIAPAMGSILVARELPEHGGETWFVSMYDAFEQLSDGLKQTLKGLRAVHSAKHAFGTEADYQDATGDRIGNPEAADQLIDPIHPVVIKHPLSGRESLYVNPSFTLRFAGWTADESAPLLSYLYERSVVEPNICRFQWRPGSIAFWDNRATWHYAQNDYAGERREMHRITLEGCELAGAA